LKKEIILSKPNKKEKTDNRSEATISLVNNAIKVEEIDFINVKNTKFTKKIFYRNQ
jgi:hypothetical protein